MQTILFGAVIVIGVLVGSAIGVGCFLSAMSVLRRWRVARHKAEAEKPAEPEVTRFTYKLPFEFGAFLKDCRIAYAISFPGNKTWDVPVGTRKFVLRSDKRFNAVTILVPSAMTYYTDNERHYSSYDDGSHAIIMEIPLGNSPMDILFLTSVPAREVKVTWSTEDQSLSLRHELPPRPPLMVDIAPQNKKPANQT